MNKDFSIWGMSYGIIGDLIMALPMLTYFEKKYPNSYKYWVIDKKCAQCAPIYFNHPLIDRIKITDEWTSFGPQDQNLMNTCDIIIPKGAQHDIPDYYNYRSKVEETARMNGIIDITDILTEDEMKPKLYKWFDVGLPKVTSTYAKTPIKDKTIYGNNIAIWPFAGSPGRSPTPQWWNLLIDNLIKRGYTVYHYGLPSDPILSELKGYRTFPELSYFAQIKAALASQLVIGTDSGVQWVMGAYSHPAINLMTNWLPNHTQNLLALEPINDNGVTFLETGGCDNIHAGRVLKNILERVPL